MRAGTVIADRFVLERLAGSGGMGDVWRAEDRTAGRPAALKLVHPGRPAFVERLELEAQALAKLAHPGVVAYLDHGRTADGRAYLAMEWLDGIDLQARLSRGPLAVAEAARLCERVAAALGAAHALGVVHRDIKPSNLFLIDGDVERVKVLDFGLAKMGSVTRLGGIAGTPGYLAPEQARGQPDVDARADVFALGCVLFECIAGRAAFAGAHALAMLVKILLEEPPQLARLRPDVPSGLSSLVERMLRKDRDARPPDGLAVSVELGALSLPTPTPRPRTSLPPRPLTTAERRLLCVLLIGAPSLHETESAPTLEVGARQPRIALLSEVAAALGGVAEPLLDGSIVVTVSGRGAATDRAAAAARLAVRARQLVPAAPMALATGLGDWESSIPVGEVIERAVALAERPASGEIWIDQVTAGLLASRWELSSTPAPHLVAERQTFAATATLLGRPSPLVGREREIRAIAAAFDACRTEQRARAVLVTGEAGAGKSRLAAEVAATLQRSGAVATVLVGRADPLHAASPLSLLADTLRRALGVHDDDPPEVRHARARAAVMEALSPEEAAAAVDFVVELLDASTAGDESEQLRAARADPVLMGDRMRAAWQLLVERWCRRGPLLLVLEDVHWADASSSAAIEVMLASLPEVPLMLLALGRPEVLQAKGGAWTRASLGLQLAPLTHQAGEQLVRNALSDVSPEQLASLLACAEGNPFHLEELVRAQREGYASSGGTVMAILHARMEALPAEARRVLRAGSVFGQTFQASAIAALLDAQSADLDHLLDALEQREVLVPCGADRYLRGDEYRFRHPLLRDAAYLTLTDEDRRRAHLLAAAWLEQASPVEAVVIAQHFVTAQETASAAGWFARAVQEALEGNDFAGAIDCAERAAQCGATGEVLGSARLWQATAHVWRGESELALRCAEQAMQLLPAGGVQWLTAVVEAAGGAVRLGDVHKVEALSATARRHTPDDARSPAYLHCMARLAHVAWVAGRTADAAAVCEAIAQPMRELVPSHAALAGRWYETLAVLADDASGVPDLRRARDAYRRAGDERRASRVRVHLTKALLDLGRPEDAAAEARELLHASQRLGLSYLEPGARLSLGIALDWLGRPDEARVELLRASSDCAAQRNLIGESECRLALAELALRAGDPETAEAEARHSMELRQLPARRAAALATLARSLVSRSPHEAIDLAHAAVAAAAPDQLPAAKLALAEAALALGDRALARVAIADAVTALRSHAERLDPDDHAPFFTRVPLHARVAQLSDALAEA